MIVEQTLEDRTKKQWLIGISASVGMVVSLFLPWFAESGAGMIATSGDLQIGVYLKAGQVAMVAAVISVAGWLLCKRLLAGVGTLIATGCVAASLNQFYSATPPGTDLAWGSVVFAVMCIAALSSLIMVGKGLAESDVRGGIRSHLERHLNPDDDGPKYIDTFIITLIAFNVLSVMIQTEEAINIKYQTFFQINEAFSTFVFSVEYVLRVWISDLNERYRGGLWGRLRYARSGMSLVDFVAIIPFFLQFIQMDLRIARAIRLMRLLRILKMGRYAHAVSTLYLVISRKKEELAITVFVTVMILILSSSAIFFAEHSAQPEEFRSIPATLWWSVVTLTSVGYGDVTPVTEIGKFVGAVVCMIGVMVVALPTGILASGFMEVMREQRGNKEGNNFTFCPHCGEELVPHPDSD